MATARGSQRDVAEALRAGFGGGSFFFVRVDACHERVQREDNKK